ncbi:hypothetical protein [Oerskovia jenensis]|uniref:hypothetical protein n=1 Tax=Oerskovia jenensis TaxID=162169 RepID=UPI0036DF57CE
MTHRDETADPVQGPQDDARGTTHEDDAARGAQASRRVGGWEVPRLEALVPEALVDRGRAVLAGVETARANAEAARESVRVARRRLRAVRASHGPPAPAVGVPVAAEHPVLRSAAEVAALLPRSFELPVRPAKGVVEPLGWTGAMYLVGGEVPQVLVRQAPAKPPSKGALLWGIVEELATDVHAGEEDLRTVELVDTDGQVLLRSALVRRRDGRGRVTRDVTLADGTLVAELVVPERKARSREVRSVGDVRTAPVLTELQDLGGGRAVARVWRGLDELASVRPQDGVRVLTIGSLAGDEEALLVWAGVLSWWGRGIG